MRHRLFSAGLLFLLAACSEQATAPEEGNPNTVAVLTVSTRDSIYRGSSIFFGTSQFDSAAWDYGQESYIHPLTSSSVMIGLDERVNLIARVDAAPWLESDGVTPISYQFLTDWQAVNPEAHPDVVYEHQSDIFFRADGFRVDAYGNRGIEVPTLYFHRISRTGSSRHILTLPATSGVVRYVFPAQRRLIGCAGNDSLVLRSSAGFQVFANDGFGREVVLPIPVSEVMLRCSVYSDEAAALAALRAVM